MYNKQVWHDRKHQVEVFRNELGEVIGTIVSFRKGICLINPQPDVLIALYQEAKIRRIQSINAIVLTDRRPELVRGLCTFLGYSRQLKRGKDLDVRLMSDDTSAANFLNSCCMQIMKNGSRFKLDLGHLGFGDSYTLGGAQLVARRTPPSQSVIAVPFLEVKTFDKTIHYYDERCTEEAYWRKEDGGPDLAVRAVQVPQFRQINVRSNRFSHV